MEKMNRRQFTKNSAKLITEMVEAGDMPVIDYVLRSAIGQKEMFDNNVSGCDGYIKKSAHQFGKAMDIYLVKLNSKGNPYIDYNWTDDEKAYKWHKRWQELGGKGMIIFTNRLGHKIEDRCHFEG